MPAWLTQGLGPWILAAFGLAFIIAVIATIRSIRESRFSPYYLLRRQAAERMRRRFVLALLLLLAWILLGVFLSQQPPIEVQLPALPFLSTPAPPTATPTATLAPQPPTPTVTATGTPTLVPPPTRVVVTSPPHTPTATRGLPAGILTPLTPRATAQPGSAFGPITIAAEVNSETGRPIVVTDTFRTGRISIYGVFTYTRMAPDMVWTHVWLRDGKPVNAETEFWTLTANGRAYITLSPAEGLLPGDYSVQLFIENRFQHEATFRVLP